MSISGWCEHCRDHFDEDHYDDEGRHLSGLEYGPTGVLMLLEECVASAEMASEGTDHVLLYVNVPKPLWKLISDDGT